jgi:G3E family GTPase
VAQTFFMDQEVARTYQIDGILTVVDAKHILEHLHEEKPEGVENESVEQVAFADRLILNKTDLVTEEELGEVEKKLKEINAAVEIIRTQNSVIDPKKLLNISAFSLDRITEMDPEFLNTDGEHMHDSRVSTCSATFEGELNMGMLQEWLSFLMQTKGADLFRYKGILAVKGFDEKFVFQGVHMLNSKSMLEGQYWKPGETRKCTFVFIGRDLDKESLIEGFKECQVGGELRFKVGDKIEARVSGGWTKGKIIKIWDDGRPYRIELEDGKKTNVWGPVDSDQFVRALK